MIVKIGELYMLAFVLVAVWAIVLTIGSIMTN